MRQRADSASVLLALRVMPWVRVLSWHATVTINSSLALGDNWFGPKRLAERSTASTLGTAATLRSTALARNVGGRIILAKHPGTCWRALARARATQLPSVYPPRDCSLSQVFVDKGVDNEQYSHLVRFKLLLLQSRSPLALARDWRR